MAERKDTPAFPTTSPLESWGDPNQGMSLRDYFAGQALAGFCTLNHEDGDAMGAADCAAAAYNFADSMIAERDKIK